MELSYGQRVALVTGAGRGIGRGIAEELAAQGLLVICVSQQAASCGAVAQAIVANGGRAQALAVDVGDSGAVKAAAESLLREHGTIDILVNNAGIIRDGLSMRMSDDEWDAVLRTNLSSCFYWSRALLPAMARKRWGRVVNISSVIGLMGNAGQVNYAAAKAGMLGLTKSLAREYAKRSVTVNAVAPGFIQTDMTSGLGEEITAAILQQVPLRRLGEVKDIAKMVTFLCAEEAGYITGQTFTVDGGMVM